MKKIGILTFHDVVNYGAALQAYALQESIRKIGCQVEILDYHEQCAGMPNQHFSLFSRVYTKLKLLNSINYNISLLKCALYSSRCKKQLFSDFRKKYMRLSSKTLFSFNDLKNIESDYDGIIVGSDMVWTKIGQDMNVFFLQFTPVRKRLSYAASLTGTQNLTSTDDAEYKKRFDEFNKIACRESEGVEYVKRVSGRNAIQTVDPTLLLSKGDWKSLLSLTITNERYILVYMFGGLSKEIRLKLNKISKEKGIPIRYIPMTTPEYCDELQVSGTSLYGPRDFVQMYMNATYVITNTFHGVVFSMIMQKPFIVLRREKGNIWKQNENRIYNILAKAGIENLYQDIESFITIPEINYSLVEANLSELINSSKKYLNSIIK